MLWILSVFLSSVPLAGVQSMEHALRMGFILFWAGTTCSMTLLLWDVELEGGSILFPGKFQPGVNSFNATVNSSQGIIGR